MEAPSIDLAGQRVLVTGAAGFIGSHVAYRLLGEGATVLGLDDLNAYYDPSLKRARLARLEPHPRFRFVQADIAEASLEQVAGFSPSLVVHLAAQVGVRHSMEAPGDYVRSNLVGFANVAELCRRLSVKHLLFASSSSVYGANTRQPFSEADPVDHPVSLYAATKRANEVHAHAYAERFGIPTTGMRFCTVYGPWSRPDMAVWTFTEALLAGRAIPLFNRGAMRRDLTYIEDAVEAAVRLLVRPPRADGRYEGPADSAAPFRLVNIGRGEPVELRAVVSALEDAFGVTAHTELWPMQPGDVPLTAANVDRLRALTGYAPSTDLREGIQAFATWWRQRP